MPASSAVISPRLLTSMTEALVTGMDAAPLLACLTRESRSATWASASVGVGAGIVVAVVPPELSNPFRMPLASDACCAYLSGNAETWTA